MTARQPTPMPTQAATPRFFVHPAYVARLLPGGVELLGFLSYLMAESVQGRAEGRQVVTVELTRPRMAEELGKSPATVKRWEAALAAKGILREVARGNRGRVLEILPPPVAPMRASRVVTHDHPKPVMNGLGSCGKAGENFVENSQMTGSRVVTSDHQNPSRVVTHDHPTGFSPYTEKRELTKSARENPRTDPDLRPRVGARAQAVRQLVDMARAEIDRFRVEHPRASRLGRDRARELTKLLSARWTAYGPEGAEALRAALSRDFRRVLSYATASGVQSPAAYLMAVLRAGDWKAAAAAGSEAAKVAKAGARAETPVQDLAGRQGPAGDRAEGSPELERLERALAALQNHPKSTPGEVARWQSHPPRTAAEAARVAAAIERQVLAKGDFPKC